MNSKISAFAILCSVLNLACSSSSPTPQIIFIADKETNSTNELYWTDLSGDSPIKLNGSLAAGRDVSSAIISHDASKVAYTADQDSGEDDFELYVVNTDGTDRVKVSGTLVAGGDVGGYEFSPDVSKIAYTADQDTDEISELYVVNIDGTNATKISGNLGAEGDVTFLYGMWSPDSSKLYYLADQDTDEVQELYVVNADGTENVKVSGAMVAGGAVSFVSPVWSPDSAKLVYIADQETDGTEEVYVVDADGNNNTKVSAAMIAGGFINDILWNADSTRIYYTTSQIVGDDNVRLYQVDADGSNHTQVGADIFGAVRVPADFSRFAYLAEKNAVGVQELFTTLIDGAGLSTLNNSPVNNGDVDINFRWSPDSSMIVYRGDLEVDNLRELYVAAADGSTITKVSRSPADTEDVGSSFGFFPKSDKVYYIADQTVNARFELYTSNIDGTENESISGELVADGDVGCAVVPGLQFNFLCDEPCINALCD